MRILIELMTTYGANKVTCEEETEAIDNTKGANDESLEEKQSRLLKRVSEVVSLAKYSVQTTNNKLKGSHLSVVEAYLTIYKRDSQGKMKMREDQWKMMKWQLNLKGMREINSKM
ncbi:hypothetical protein QN277_019321 [Acacia crassicarpa]|uniref:Uncharacterized protein n=1 Tax=Acacia crassicarpa TaxID=499986 RepID=A0AAE1KIX4_9FABA|nr:hypothetical protein QN277_019321 [Acacia crassicarpa]